MTTRPPIRHSQPHIDNLKWAEAILFVYPTWWYGLPAMLKGWLDRVWATDVVFKLPQRQGPHHVADDACQAASASITTCGAPLWWTHPRRPARPQDHPARHAGALRHALPDDVPRALSDGCLDR